MLDARFVRATLFLLGIMAGLLISHLRNDRLPMEITISRPGVDIHVVGTGTNEVLERVLTDDDVSI